jgi:hypothetical protein
MQMNPRGRDRARGQALVEFSIVLVPFLLLVMGMVDMGRGIYTYNGVSHAAREIARETAVNPYDVCCDIGTGAGVESVKASQKSLVPGLTDAGITIECVSIQNEVIPDLQCHPNDFIRTTIEVPFQPITPLLGQLGPFDLTAVARVEMTNVSN